jgi:predicted membrane-bound spermidine synthase
MRRLAVRHGYFGKIRIVERISDGARFYLTGAGLQTHIDKAGVSLFGYTNAMKLMLRDKERVLMIGGAGGSLATMLARKGHRVEVVDIDPVARDLAIEFFGLDGRVTWVTMDAGDYLAATDQLYDAIVMDACTSEHTVSAFTSADWIAGAMDRVAERGALMVNLSYDEPPPFETRDLADAVAACGFHAILLQPQSGWEGNEILQVTRHATAVTFSNTDVFERPAEARTYLLSLGAYAAAPGAPDLTPALGGNNG